MAHTYTNCLFHCTFSTKYRRKLITEDISKRLWPFIGGIARENGFRALQVGGDIDHAHTLIALPPTMTLCKALQEMKGGSSKFMNETFFTRKVFAWQDGYGAFSLGADAVPDVVTYIQNQREHHKTRTFEEEYIAFLEENGIEYDIRYVFD